MSWQHAFADRPILQMEAFNTIKMNEAYSSILTQAGGQRTGAVDIG
jgi:hypothetical protein